MLFGTSLLNTLVALVPKQSSKEFLGNVTNLSS